jgi:ribosomal protein S18 acetylase RimI-like enzyme
MWEQRVNPPFMLGRLLRDLAPYAPTLIGTFPLGLQIESSDLDIACSCADLDAFERALRVSLDSLGETSVRIERLSLDPEAVVAEITVADPPIEIFCQPLPIHAQVGFRHMVIEGRLLALGGAALRDRVLARKRAGLKTEPAFAELLGLTGDPYAALLVLESWPQSRLESLVAAALRPGPPPAISLHTGDRAALLPLFRLADDSERELAGYLDLGDVLVASELDGELVGHAQMIESDAPATWELKSLAVVESHRGGGLGRRLVLAGLAHARDRGAQRVIVSTGTADTGVLRFYQRLGFRLTRIDPDVFTPEAGYPPGLTVDGIPLLDRAWLDRAV